jgi:hypothetical protein
VFQSLPQKMQTATYWGVLVGFEATRNLTKLVHKRKFHVFCNVLRCVKRIRTWKHKSSVWVSHRMRY